MKKVLLSIAFASLLWAPVFAATPLTGKIIALDAGHGGGETGAVNKLYGVKEENVNLSVVNVLKAKLEASEVGAYVVVAARLSSRKDRVDDAIAQCAALDFNRDGAGDGRKCDALISVHHNGNNVDSNHDGTLVIYNEKKDKPLAEKMLAALVPLTGQSEGLENGGYGMTVYGNLVSVLTEAYYITNDAKAWRYLYDLNAEGVSNLVVEEADAQVRGLADYFASRTSGGKGGRK